MKGNRGRLPGSINARGALGLAAKLQTENERLRAGLAWLLHHTSGKELRRMVGELSDTSNLDEFISAIERARSC